VGIETSTDHPAGAGRKHEDALKIRRDLQLTAVGRVPMLKSGLTFENTTEFH
jgi:hypothetical protein